MPDRELLLLGLLHQQEMHGYRLYEFIESELSFCTDLKKSTAYYLLDKMADKGWIAEEQEQSGGRPARNVFHLTAAGEAAFHQLLIENLSSANPPPFEGDIGLAFLDSMEAGAAVDLLAQRRDEYTEMLEAARRAPEHGGGPQLVIEHQRRFLEHEIEWTELVLDRLWASEADQPNGVPK
ncbi:MAG: PadR family transcriptional regulator [Anaerolineales bacterium]